ncbi:hypothetical protein PCG10_004980 [Penicillium crustosum]|uniref:Uncharacterized protein n=1 Tax=Penicillium crustosum TaxID=36656 RepID=A0A9P5GS56_PENCR|nr:uncharacterized protein N7487_006917 [Penicillium crustosum]KAF7530005.1 hypothetical protein PCG10_004980 [Penicillium crustosum]KAJ5412558.1 hypothetical protein N7487_006917 [Penicillium crustosum]
MFIKPALQALLALSIAVGAVADQEVVNSPASGPLSINYGKCYKIQTEQRTWMANRGDGYQRWDYLLKKADIYKVCQHKVDGSCEYDAVRPVQGGEDYFLWAFNAYNGQGANLLAVWNWFFPSYDGYRDYIFHFQGEAECGHGTNPCAIRTGGHNEKTAKGLTGVDFPARATDGSTVLLWYHEVDCPE